MQVDPLICYRNAGLQYGEFMQCIISKKRLAYISVIHDKNVFDRMGKGLLGLNH